MLRASIGTMARSISPSARPEGRTQTMWPFKKKPAVQVVPVQDLKFSQVDTTERFGDNLDLGADDWIATSPLNSEIPNPECMGLPPRGASENDVYSTASRLSRVRDLVQLPDDGVYCPICHIANVDLLRLGTPCPKCGRQLLRFGWD
jgi:hypothetical protein